MPFLVLTFRTVYCDETADESSGINVHQPTAFAHKLLQLSGVSLFWDEFSASAKSSPVCSTAPVVRKTKPELNHRFFKDLNGSYFARIYNVLMSFHLIWKLTQILSNGDIFQRF